MKAGRILLLETGLVGLIMLTPLVFGAVYSWAFMAVSAVLFSLVLVCPESFLEIKQLPLLFRLGLAVLFAGIFLQIFKTSLNHYETFQKCLQWLALLGGFLVIQVIPRHSVLRLMVFLVAAALLESVYGFYQVTSGQEQVLWLSKEFHRGFVTGTYLNRNHLAGFLEICLGAHLGLWLDAFWKRKIKTVIGLGFLMALILMVFIKTGSRAGLLSLSVAFFIMSPLLIGRGPRFSFIFLLSFVFLGGVLICLGHESVFLRLDELRDHLTTWEGRLTVWRDTLDMIKDHRWLGVGLGNFHWVFPAYQSAVLTWGWSHAHNDYLELLSEFGIPLFTMMIFVCLVLFFWVFSKMQSLNESYYPAAWGGLVSLAAFSMHALTDFNFAIPANMMLMIFVAGMICRLVRKHSHDDPGADDVPDPDRVKTRNRFHVIQKVTVRIIALLLMFLCLQEAWAGVWLYRGQTDLKKMRYSQAMESFNKVEGRMAWNPQLIYDYGRAAWELSEKNKQTTLILFALKQFQTMTELMPYYGRAWLYKAQCQSKLLTREGKKITLKEWQTIDPCIDKAYRQEMGSAWMSYMTGTQLLTFREFLTPEQVKSAIARLKFSASVLPSRYLLPVLTVFWKNFQDFELLEQTVPQNYEAYRRFVSFIRQNELWTYAPRVFPFYYELKNVTYNNLCQKGLQDLHQWNYRRALINYQKAYWILPERARAKAGILISKEGLADLPRGYRATLKQVLEADEEDLSPMWKLLRDVVDLAPEPYTEGLYAFRLGDYTKASEWLMKPNLKGQWQRRYLAESYWLSGRNEQALALLSPVLKEKDPDLREVLLLSQWDSSYQEEAKQKVNSEVTIAKPQRAWWGKGFKEGRLDHRGKVGMLVNLKPGVRTFMIYIPSHAEAQGRDGFLIFRLQNQVIGTAYVTNLKRDKITLQTRTSGGKRWFEAELLSGPKNTDGKSEPIVELGSVEIH